MLLVSCELGVQCADLVINGNHFFREREARDTAMAVPLPEENKGFAMLQKMGYKYVGRKELVLPVARRSPTFNGA